MYDKITPEFLEGNLFEKPKQTCGWTHWFYTEKHKYEIVISIGDNLISCVNYETGEEISFLNRKTRPLTCTKSNLKRCLQFIGIKDEFDYSL